VEALEQRLSNLTKASYPGFLLNLAGASALNLGGSGLSQAELRGLDSRAQEAREGVVADIRSGRLANLNAREMADDEKFTRARRLAQRLTNGDYENIIVITPKAAGAEALHDLMLALRTTAEKEESRRPNVIFLDATNVDYSAGILQGLSQAQTAVLAINHQFDPATEFIYGEVIRWFRAWYEENQYHHWEAFLSEHITTVEMDSNLTAETLLLHPIMWVPAEIAQIHSMVLIRKIIREAFDHFMNTEARSFEVSLLALLSGFAAIDRKFTLIDVLDEGTKPLMDWAAGLLNRAFDQVGLRMFLQTDHSPTSQHNTMALTGSGLEQYLRISIGVKPHDDREISIESGPYKGQTLSTVMGHMEEAAVRILKHQKRPNVQITAERVEDMLRWIVMAPMGAASAGRMQGASHSDFDPTLLTQKEIDFLNRGNN